MRDEKHEIALARGEKLRGHDVGVRTVLDPVGLDPGIEVAAGNVIELRQEGVVHRHVHLPAAALDYLGHQRARP